MLKNELKRAFTSKGMILAILLGQGINIYYIASVLIQKKQKMDHHNFLIESKGINLYLFLSQNTPFDVWLLGRICQTLVIMLYILPIMATLPYAASFAREKKIGYSKNVLSRTSRTRYRTNKCIAVFLSGGVAAASVFVVNLMWCFTYIKFKMPVSSSTAPLTYGDTMMGVMYYSHPFLYSFIYIMAVFIFAGSVALISLLISQITTNPFTVLLTPFLVIMLFNMVLTGEWQFYKPMQFLMAGNGGKKIYMVPLIFIIVVIFISVGFIYGCRKKDEL